MLLTLTQLLTGTQSYIIVISNIRKLFLHPFSLSLFFSGDYLTTMGTLESFFHFIGFHVPDILCREAIGKILAKGHSRVPVYSGNPKNIIGLLLVRLENLHGVPTLLLFITYISIMFCKVAFPSYFHLNRWKAFLQLGQKQRLQLALFPLGKFPGKFVFGYFRPLLITIH